jgi:hypothetical protein
MVKYYAGQEGTIVRNCEIHNTELHLKLCIIHYGLYRPIEYLYTPKEWEEKQKYDSSYSFSECDLFKNAYLKNYVHGGCSVRSQKTQWVLYCTICNKNKKKWLKENFKNKPFPDYNGEAHIKLPRMQAHIMIQKEI